MAAPGDLVQMILNTVRRDLLFTWIDENPNKAAALSLDEVNAAINECVDSQNLVMLRPEGVGRESMMRAVCATKAARRRLCNNTGIENSCSRASVP
jgi:hypothetical protein